MKGSCRSQICGNMHLLGGTEERYEKMSQSTWIWKAIANIINKSRTADKRWSVKKQHVTTCYTEFECTLVKRAMNLRAP